VANPLIGSNMRVDFKRLNTIDMINIQNEVQKIHNQYGMSEMANYKIQLLCEKYAKDYHDSEVKKLNILDVIESDCDCVSYTYSETGKRRWCTECGRENIGF
jgi:hypothetical protein